MPDNIDLTGDTPKSLGRRSLLRVAATGGALALGVGLSALGVGLSALPESTRSAAAAPSLFAVAGTWWVQVAFQYGQFSGLSEQTVAHFEVTNYSGGIMSQVVSVNQRPRYGTWQANPDDSYTYHLVEFTYDPTTNCVNQVVVPTITVVLGADLNSFTSTNTSTTIYHYDPQSGKQTDVIGPMAGISIVTGQRIGMNWTPPAQFPPAP
jgi:hypothetical protein